MKLSSGITIATVAGLALFFSLAAHAEQGGYDDYDTEQELQSEAELEARQNRLDAERNRVEAVREAERNQREAVKEAQENQREAVKEAEREQQNAVRAAREAEIEAARRTGSALPDTTGEVLESPQ